MATLIVTVFIASLMGSMHCVGMCGALVVFAVGTPDAASTGRGQLQFLYHGGRLFGYTLIGAACGFAGSLLDLGGTVVGLQRLAGIMAGTLMVAAGGMVLLRYSNWRLPHLAAPTFWQQWIVKAQRAASSLAPQPRALSIGLLTGLLPCGWLYLFAVTAAGTGSPAIGAVVMAAFWAGSVPGLLLVGLGAQFVTRWLGTRAPLVSSLAIIILGVSTLAGRMQHSLADFERQAVGAVAQPTETIDIKAQFVPMTDTVEHVKSLSADKAPCCPHGH